MMQRRLLMENWPAIDKYWRAIKVVTQNTLAFSKESYSGPERQ